MCMSINVNSPFKNNLQIIVHYMYILKVNYKGMFKRIYFVFLTAFPPKIHISVSEGNIYR